MSTRRSDSGAGVSTSQVCALPSAEENMCTHVCAQQLESRIFFKDRETFRKIKYSSTKADDDNLLS